MNRFIATFFYSGLSPKAPGTIGSMAALPFGWLIHGLTGFPGLLIATILVFFLGWWATANVTRGQQDHDPGEIVIDEVVGQWIALFPLSYGLWQSGAAPWLFPYPGWIAAFVFFRLFDIWKPWPVSWADHKNTALGVMLDDVLAGIMAAIVVALLAGIAHGIM